MAGETLLDASLRRVFAILTTTADTDPLPRQDGSSLGQLVHNLLMIIARHRAGMDWILKQQASGRLRPRTRRVFWWAMAEMFFCNGVPAPAVVAAAAGFIARRHSSQEAGFVNALLRRLAAQTDFSAWLEGCPAAVAAGLPDEIFRRWQLAFGPEQTATMARFCQIPAPAILRRRPGAPSAPLTPAGLIPLPEFAWAPGVPFFRFERQQDSLRDLLQARPECYYVQDPATLLAPLLLQVQPGDTVADVCCAPGGKALVLAEQLQGCGFLHCQDKSPARLQTVQENLRGCSRLEIRANDACTPILPPASLDALLLDVPCTNTGVMRRKPDVRWNFSANRLHELAALQHSLLEANAPLLKPGGRLVYSTCSVEKEENHDQIQAFLQRHPGFVLKREQQLLPDSDHDGAYAALLIRS